MQKVLIPSIRSKSQNQNQLYGTIKSVFEVLIPSIRSKSQNKNHERD